MNWIQYLPEVVLGFAVGMIASRVITLYSRVDKLELDIVMERSARAGGAYEAKDDYYKARVWCEHAVQDERKRTDALARAAGFKWQETPAQLGWVKDDPLEVHPTCPSCDKKAAAWAKREVEREINPDRRKRK